MRGQLLRDRGRDHDACEILGKAIEIDINRSEAYIELALAQANIPAWRKQAVETIERAVAIAPTSASCLGFQAFILSQCGFQQRALEAADCSLCIDPNCLIALVGRANAFTRLSQWSMAEQTARQILEVNPRNTGGMNLLAQALRFQGKVRESIVVTRVILSFTPEDAFAQTNAGFEALETGDHRRANQNFLNALRLEPTREMARKGLVKSLRSRVWLYQMNAKVGAHFKSGRPMKGIWLVLFVVTTLASGGLTIMFFCLMVPVVLLWSNFFLLLDPVGRHALSSTERSWGMIGGLLTCAALSILAWNQQVEWLAVVAATLLLFAVSIYLPRWEDEWQAKRERRLMKD